MDAEHLVINVRQFWGNGLATVVGPYQCQWGAAGHTTKKWLSIGHKGIVDVVVGTLAQVENTTRAPEDIVP